MIKRLCASIVLASMVFVGGLALAPSYAQAVEAGKPAGGYFNDITLPAGASKPIQQTIIDLLNIVLGFLGLIAVIIIIAAGFMWMTAGGNEKRLETARKLLIQGFIGLVLVMAAWAIALFVITTFETQFFG
ncbi:hypothetical protein HYV71_04360 [Candidatus Uhrbacteria bacterium]|nr:hypothetical protein [Candidatus Uhrbacteria bacterium]